MFQMKLTDYKKGGAKSGSMVLHDKPEAWAGKKGGVVNYCVHGTPGKRPGAHFTAPKLVEVLRNGLPVQELDDLQASLKLPMERLGTLLGISKATLHRLKASG